MGSPERHPRVLVIDDEPQIRRALASVLQVRNYEVEVAETGEEGLDKAIARTPDVIVLDLTLPGMSGLEVARSLREWFEGPILVLSVLSGDSDKIAALDLGADDYLTKPFSTGELLARIRALLRRTQGLERSCPEASIGDIRIDFGRREVTVRGEAVRLTRIEFDVLALLARNVDRVVTSKMLLENVWGPEYVADTQTLRVHISHLRSKLECPGDVPRHILTEPGVGFRLVAFGDGGETECDVTPDRPG